MDTIQMIVHANYYTFRYSKMLSKDHSRQNQAAFDEFAEKAQNNSQYPNLVITKNINKQFLCSEDIPDNYKTIRIDDPRIQMYFSAVKRLLGTTMGEIRVRDLWVCQKITTVYPILVYFTQPEHFPVMECCRRCIFIQFQSQLSGSVRCVGCKKMAFSFVHIGDCPRLKTQNKYSQNKRYSKTQNSQHKQSSQIEKQMKQMDKENEKIYRDIKLRNQSKKSNIRRLISSNQHRQKSLKKVMGLTSQIRNEKIKGSLIEDQTKNDQNKLSFEGDLRAQHNPIGQFIIEIKQKASQPVPKAEQAPKPTTNSLQSLTEQQQQLKKIIQQIFS